MNPLTQSKKTTILPFLITLALVSFGISPRVAAQPVPGAYELSFFKFENLVGLIPVSSLSVCTPSVCEELILGAHVEEQSSGLPAQGGAVIFQYCSLPPSDITRADEAPTAACDSGLATWKDLHALLKVNESGDAFLDFGIVLIPRTVGFRFRYIGQGSGIANGVSLPKDFTWNP
jgi:hypothetical protein